VLEIIEQNISNKTKMSQRACGAPSGRHYIIKAMGTIASIRANTGVELRRVSH